MNSALDKTKKRKRPIDARTFKDVCALTRDNIDSKHFWLMIDGGDVVIAEQTNGEALKNKLSIPRAEFDRLARWYVTGRATK